VSQVSESAGLTELPVFVRSNIIARIAPCPVAEGALIASNPA
jgi:hypothetical protein